MRNNYINYGIKKKNRLVKRLVGFIGMAICCAGVATYFMYSQEPKLDKVQLEEVQAVSSQNQMVSVEKKVVTDWKLILVNPWNDISADHEVNTVAIKNGQLVDERILPDLQEMMDDCRAEGLVPFICSSYRTLEDQQNLFNNEVESYLNKGYSREKAEEIASGWVALPGTSEHQLGLAIDVVSSFHRSLDKSQETTPEQQWFIKNSYKYGFILRYPEGKTHITGINYEPWHYRYVGKEVAAEIAERGITLEEYLEDNLYLVKK